MRLQQIKALAEKKKYDEALSACHEYLNRNPDDRIELLRVRAYVYSLMRDYQNALQDRKTILETGEAELRDYYQAGASAISMRDLKSASSFLKKVLILGAEQNNSWFDSAAFFFLSYIQMELGKYEDAIKSLDNAVDISPNCSMPIPGVGMWDHTRLRKEILHRKGERGHPLNFEFD